VTVAHLDVNVGRVAARRKAVETDTTTTESCRNIAREKKSRGKQKVKTI